MLISYFEDKSALNEDDLKKKSNTVPRSKSLLDKKRKDSLKNIMIKF